MNPTIIGATVVGIISKALAKVKYGILDESAKAINSPIVSSMTIPVNEIIRVFLREAKKGVNEKTFRKLAKPIKFRGTGLVCKFQ